MVVTRITTNHIGGSPYREEPSSQALEPVALPPPPLTQQSLLVTLAQQVEALAMAVRGLQ